MSFDNYNSKLKDQSYEKNVFYVKYDIMKNKKIWIQNVTSKSWNK